MGPLESLRQHSIAAHHVSDCEPDLASRHSLLPPEQVDASPGLTAPLGWTVTGYPPCQALAPVPPAG